MLDHTARVLPLVVLVTASLACSKDEQPGADEVAESGESVGSESETAADEIGDTTESESTSDDEGNFVPADESESDSTETSPPEPKTCREMLDCVFMCLGDLGLECLQTCGEGFDPIEVQKATELVLCLGQQCFEKDQCTLTDFTAEACIGCIGLGLFLPEPPGCEEQAMACE